MLDEMASAIDAVVVATQFEGKLEYEPIGMKIVNSAEADALLRCEYRQGWAL
jgi:hypothetical protein